MGKAIVNVRGARRNSGSSYHPPLRDAWAHTKPTKPCRKRSVRNAKRAARLQVPKATVAEIAGHYSPETKLWFGPHNNKPLRQVPLSYLSWLSEQRSENWRSAGLSDYLRRFYIPEVRNSLSGPSPRCGDCTPLLAALVSKDIGGVPRAPVNATCGDSC